METLKKVFNKRLTLKKVEGPEVALTPSSIILTVQGFK